jgi:transcriptional regulator with XRE-family HTH domain
VPAKQNVSPIDRALASVLKGAYKTRDITQEQLTARTGISKTTMQRLMAGKSAFEVEQLFALADAIGWKTAQDYLREAEALVKAD